MNNDVIATQNCHKKVLCKRKSKISNIFYAIPANLVYNSFPPSCAEEKFIELYKPDGHGFTVHSDICVYVSLIRELETKFLLLTHAAAWKRFCLQSC